LTLLILLVLIARMRSRGFDENEIEQAAVTATRQAIARTSVPEPTIALPSGSTPRAEAAWGSGEFGNVWGGSGTTETSVGSATYTNGANGAKPSGGDPWASSW
jgi:hypothetical protein